MNDLAVIDLSTASRIDVRDLSAMPNDMVHMIAAARDLTCREFGVWNMLRMHLWMYGSLPTGSRSLARIGRLGTPAFERIAPALAHHFDRTPEGGWTDHALVKARGTRVIIPSEELPAVKPSISAARRVAGKRGGEATQALARQARAIDSEPAADFASTNEANFASNSSKTEPHFASTEGEIRKANASGAGCLSVCLLDSEKQNEEQTDKQTSKPASASGAGAEAKPQANPVALGEAKSHLGDDAIIQAIVAAYDRKVDAAHVFKRLPEIRESIAKGCNLSLDIVPECREFSRGKTTIENCFNIHVRTAAFTRRDVRLRTSTSRSDVTGIVRVYRDDPAGTDLVDGALARVGMDPRKCFVNRDADRKYVVVDREGWNGALAAERAARRGPS